MSNLAPVLAKAAPKADRRFVANAPDTSALERYGIVSNKALAGLLGQMAHETGGFRQFEENLNYRAARLCQIWPTRFNAGSASACAGNPERIANMVYANRMGNGPPVSGDGWRNRGSGGLQHTGETERQRVKKRTGATLEALRNPANATAILFAAASYAQDRGALAALNTGDVVTSTRKINGGQIGIDDRRVWVARFDAALAGQPAPKARTNAESATRARTNAVVAGTGTTMTATATGTATQPGTENQSTVPALVTVGIVLVIGAALVWALLAKAKRHDDAIDAQRREKDAALEGVTA